MRPLLVLAIAAALALPLPGSAGIKGLRPGGVSGLGPSQPKALKPAPRRHDRGEPHHGKRRFYYPLIVGRERVERETVYVPVPVAVPAPPERPALPPAPPDPRGPATWLPARGSASPAPALAPGDAIAAALPLVLLDWRDHALPEPGPGRHWVRIGRQVRLIDIAGREVVALPPEGAGRPVSSP